MAKKWTDFTTREKVIGVLVVLFAVFTISGISSAMAGKSSPSVAPSTQDAAQVITYKEIQETEAITFAKENKDDSSRDFGKSAVTTIGVDGVKTKTYKITLIDGTETNRELTSEVVTTQPVTEVTSVGTYIYVAPPEKAASNCDPNYSGACVPIASDVDCAGGSGNGPAYVSGPVYVIGTDIYGLDRDGNGVGCE